VTGLPDPRARPDGPVPADPAASDGRTDEAPPIFRTWGTLYAAVLMFLAALIAAFYFFQETFQ
jgi:hypothetical protein